MKSRVLVLLTITALLAVAVPGFAQVRDGKLLITVVDATGGVLPGAQVTVVGLDNATKAVTIPAIKASDKGLATADSLLPGRYRMQVEFNGFEIGTRDVSVKSGENKQTIVLK